MQPQNFFPHSSNSNSRGQSRMSEPESWEVWSFKHLLDFAMRMAMNGMPVNRVRLRNDPVYTLKQLAAAHTANDEILRDMAMSLFRQFERNQSGIRIEE